MHDPRRSDFIRGFVEAVEHALAAGVDVRGYFYWSLMDNFEWAEGYTPRFRLVYVDYQTQHRIIKESGFTYRSLINARRQDDDPLKSIHQN